VNSANALVHAPMFGARIWRLTFRDWTAVMVSGFTRKEARRCVGRVPMKYEVVGEVLADGSWKMFPKVTP
jgi:hypothetical protein